jgi:hypothetical protein
LLKKISISDLGSFIDCNFIVLICDFKIINSI